MFYKFFVNEYTVSVLKLIIFLVLASFVVYLAQHNLMPVTLYIGRSVFPGIPLFYVIIGSLLTGLGFAYLMYLINSIFVAFTMRGKDTKIKQGKNEIVDLTKRIHQLELENEKLKTDSARREPQDTNAL